MILPPKLVTVLSLVQFFVVLAGYFVTRASLKIWDTVGAGPSMPRIPPFVEVIQTGGLWFMLVPVGWCIIAALRANITHGGASITVPHFIFGMILTIAVVAAFALSALYAMHTAYGPIGSTPFRN